MRKGDQKLAVTELIRKFLYERSSDIVARGWK